jgi:YVTN family beta-propeller protein
MRGQVTGCVAYTPNYPCVYVVNSAPDTVSVINSTTNTVIVPAVAVGGTPMGAAITPDNRSLYVVNNDDATVSIVDTTTNTTPTSPVLLISGGAALGSPTQVAITPDGTAAYVVGVGATGFVAVIDTATQKLAPAITTGLTNPTAIAFSPDGKFAYISDSCPSGPTATACVDVLDTSTHLINQTPGTPIQIPGSVQAQVSSIAVTSDGGLICVSVNDANAKLGIAFISTSNNAYTYLSTLSLGVVSSSSDYGIAITPGGILYAAEPALNSVAVVDTNTQTLSNNITVGNSPTGIAATPDGAQVYVSNAGAGTVSVIDTQTQKVTATLQVQTSPAGVAVMPTIVPSVQTQPASQTITNGQSASLSVGASGSIPLSYQWFQFSGSTPVPIPGATSSTFTTPALTSTTTYLVRVSNVAGSIESDAAKITVLPPVPPDFSIGPAPGSSTSETINAGQQASFTLALMPAGSFSGTINLSCAVTPVVTPAPTCGLSSSQINFSGGTPQVTVSVGTMSPNAVGTVSYLNLPPSAMPLIWSLALLASVWFWAASRMRLRALAPIMALAIGLCVGCGRSSSSQNFSGTPPGTYTATVTATSGNLSHNMALQVMVR